MAASLIWAAYHDWREEHFVPGGRHPEGASHVD